jgi:hypothetical protein
MAKRRRKTAFQKLRAKANKAVAKRMRAVRKTVAKRAKRISRTAGKAVRKTEKFLASDSLAKAGRRAAKRANRASKRAFKRSAKSVRRSIKQVRKARKTAKALVTRAKRFQRDRRRQRKQAATQARREQRAREREFNRLTLSGDESLVGATIRELKASSERGASRPGEPPKMRTGKGRKSITAELRMKGKKPEARTYVDKKVAEYMAMWEFRQDGKQRPFLKPAVEDNLNLLGQEIGNAMKQQLRPQAGRKKAVVK